MCDAVGLELSVGGKRSELNGGTSLLESSVWVGRRRLWLVRKYILGSFLADLLFTSRSYEIVTTYAIIHVGLERTSVGGNHG
jgi:hypothetical protein